jgi:hypothetical protein
MTTVTFSCPHDLKERIQAAADRQNRTVSNYLTTEIEKFLASVSFSPPSTPEGVLASEVAALIESRLSGKLLRSDAPSVENPRRVSSETPKKRSQ